jgi:hypothetical protein
MPLFVFPEHQGAPIDLYAKKQKNASSTVGYKCSLLHHHSPQNKPNRLMFNG